MARNQFDNFALLSLPSVIKCHLYRAKTERIDLGNDKSPKVRNPSTFEAIVLNLLVGNK